MELYQMKCFYEAAKLESITKAAGVLHISQPALSKTINRLEEDLGVSLFDRKAKTVRLNQYGRAVMEHIEKVFSVIEDLHQNLEDIQHGDIGEIRIGSTMPSSDDSWLLDCIRAFVTARPKITIAQHIMKPEELKTALINGDIDIAIGGTYLVCPELAWTEIRNEPVGVLMNEADPLAEGESVSVAELRERVLFCNNSNADMELLTYDVCARAGFRPNVLLSSNYSRLIGELVSSGRGIVLVPEYVFQGMRQKGEDGEWKNRIVMRAVREEYCSLRAGVAVSRERYISTAAKALYEEIIRYRKEM